MTSHSFPVRGTACAVAASFGLLIGAGFALDARAADDRSERLEHYRAACLLNRPNANVDACIEETLAARAAAPRGELQDGDAAYRRNALLRCRALPPADQPACEARMQGVGTASGSVEEGGILRELVVREQAGTRPTTPTRAVTPLHIDPNGDSLSDSIPAEPASRHGPRVPR